MEIKIERLTVSKEQCLQEFEFTMLISEKLPKFKRQFWPNKRTDGQTDTKVHTFNILGITYMKIKIERLTVSEEQCLQKVGRTNGQTDGRLDGRTDKAKTICPR